MPELLQLGSAARLALSGETGIIVGRAEFTYCEPKLLIRMKGADGRQIEEWWTATAVEPL